MTTNERHAKITLKNIIHLITPPVLVKLAKLIRGEEYGLSGNYRNWNEAMAKSAGYDSKIILEKTKAALLKVKNGDAVYERDSVIFDEIHYSWPLLAGLMWVAARCNGRLNVLDFGGSLGSTYYQNRAFLSALPSVRWNIVEQSSHVRIGKAFFEDNNLRYYVDAAECLTETQPNVVILSGVLQYLERPYTVFDQMLGLPCAHLIIDRTPYWNGPIDRLCVQAVPPNIYPASYPSWIFSRQLFHSHLDKNWQIIATFDNPDTLTGPVDFSYQGVIIARNKQVS
jgi:putative methyltransferase (TIGR04325 family)